LARLSCFISISVTAFPSAPGDDDLDRETAVLCNPDSALALGRSHFHDLGRDPIHGIGAGRFGCPPPPINSFIKASAPLITSSSGGAPGSVYSWTRKARQGR